MSWECAVVGGGAAGFAAVEMLRRLSPDSGNVHLFLDHATGRAMDVPDPYYGAGDGFERVYRMIHDASEALAEKLATRDPSLPKSGHASSIR